MQKSQIDIHNENEEYRQVRKDLIFVVIMNLTFLVIMLGLFFFNRSTGMVDQFFANILKF